MSLKQQLDKLFKEKKLSNEDFNTLIVEYINKEMGKEPTSEELNLISQLFRSGVFNLDYVIDMIGQNPDKYGVQINKLYSKTGELIKRYVHEL